jgi:hypothetical protein
VVSIIELQRPVRRKWLPVIGGPCARISPPASRDHRPSSGKGIPRRWRILVELRSPDDARQRPIRVGKRWVVILSVSEGSCVRPSWPTTSTGP